MTSYFVSGIGTGVGKTFTTCALLHAANGSARGYKPVISGWSDGADTDTAQIIAASGGMASIEDVSPWRFIAPLSPHVAAAKEGRSLDIAALKQWTMERAEEGQQGFIETVGGVMVPLTNRITTLDWMAEVALPAILVTGSYLGSISHTLTAIAALRSRGIVIAALVMNESDGSTVTLAQAEEGLQPFITDIPLRIVQPRVFSWQEAREIHCLLEHLA
jgi:dethiobiotin synthetase